jgi:hypothetical protein
VSLLRQSIYSRLAGYEDVNDAERLAVDPAMRHVVGGRASQPEKQAASVSEVGRFETDMLSTKANIKRLMDLSGEWIDRVHQRKPSKKLILDMDSSVSETYGQQEGSAYNGHFECTCYHPLFLFNQDGDLERAMLRRGNKASAKFWRRVLLPVIARYRHLDIPKLFRGDAAFARPALYRLLEQEGYQYAIRLPANDVLEREIAHLLTRPVGRPPQKPIVLYAGFLYRAASWSEYRRVVAKVEWHRDELYPRVGFIVTNTWKAPEDVVHFYRRSRHGRAVDQGRQERREMDEAFLLCARRTTRRGYSCSLLPTTWPTSSGSVALPPSIKHWSLTTLREKLVKIGAKVVRHAKYVTFQLAEVAVPRKLFRAILRRIAKLRFADQRGSPG